MVRKPTKSKKITRPLRNKRIRIWNGWSEYLFFRGGIGRRFSLDKANFVNTFATVTPSKARLYFGLHNSTAAQLAKKNYITLVRSTRKTWKYRWDSTEGLRREKWQATDKDVRATSSSTPWRHLINVHFESQMSRLFQLLLSSLRNLEYFGVCKKTLAAEKGYRYRRSRVQLGRVYRTPDPRPLAARTYWLHSFSFILCSSRSKALIYLVPTSSITTLFQENDPPLLSSFSKLDISDLGLYSKINTANKYTNIITEISHRDLSIITRQFLS